MPFLSRRARLSLTDEDRGWLDQLAQSRTEAVARVQRAQMLLRYAQGQTVSAVAQALHTNRPRVERCVSKALELGVRAALRDLPGRGRRRSLTDEDKTWVVDLACQKPKHRSVVATENCAMAVPCWLYFTSGSRPRYPINITFCMSKTPFWLC